MVIFRVDGNSSIGLGHVMRCLSIADEFKREGTNSIFVSADNELQKTIIGRGFENYILNTKYNDLEAELYLIERLLDKTIIEFFIVDSYYVSQSYLASLLRMCNERQILLVYIDDILSFPYPCNILINYNIYACNEDYNNLYEGFSKPVFLLGTSYTPLRFEFQKLPKRILRQTGNDILISTGGADFEHIGIELIRTITERPEWINIQFHFILGLMNKDRDEIRTIVKKTKNIQLHENVSQMAKLMQSCDVAITAAGSTMYELCATQTPSLTYILADNQIPGAEGFEEKGVLHTIGDIRIIGLKRLAEHVLFCAVELLENYTERSKITRKMKEIVDGKGAYRIVSFISELRSERII